jgi:hypothetical protein
MVLRQVSKILGIFVSLLALALLASACTAPYRTYTFLHETKPVTGYGVGYRTHFSFEYPAGYKLVNKYAQSAPQAPINVRFSSGTTTFGVNVGLPNRDTRNSKMAADKTVDSVVSFLNDPTLIQRSAANISGIAAEIIVFPDNRGPGNLMVQAMFFDFDDRIWDLFIYSQISSAEQAKLDLEHIVETFKILP